MKTVRTIVLIGVLTALGGVPLIGQVHKFFSPGTVWTVIQHDETTAVVEMYTMLCNGVEPQSTVARFSVADEGIYAVAYSASRKGAFPAARRKAWMDILSRVTGREACAPRP